ncbi:MAG: hypothetical protein EBT79_09660 [Actinobacteria bacterium]|nr:hypothetical protein [Actinomycetota bacterium]NBR67520.1 hypothetical protein [Actinomycetota bacterium]
MIVEFTNRRGQRTFTMNHADLVAATEWARAMCHIAYGPEEGEARFRALPAKPVLSLWAVRPDRNAEA